MDPFFFLIPNVLGQFQPPNELLNQNIDGAVFLPTGIDCKIQKVAHTNNRYNCQVSKYIFDIFTNRDFKDKI